MSRPARSWSRIARRVASSWASSMNAGSTRQSSRARTRGGKRSRSLSRSSSQEGWAYEPTRFVGRRVSAACGGIGRPLAAVEGVAVSERGGRPSSGRLHLEVRDLDPGVLELDLEAALDRRRERELDAAALLDVLHEVVAVDVDLVGRVGDDAQADLIALAERQRLDAALRLAAPDGARADPRLTRRGPAAGPAAPASAAGALPAGAALPVLEAPDGAVEPPSSPPGRRSTNARIRTTTVAARMPRRWGVVMVSPPERRGCPAGRRVTHARPRAALHGARRQAVVSWAQVIEA